jgi:isopentenyl-diphosphate delta-isomerase
MTSPVNKRKLEHIRVIQKEAETDRQKHYFDHIRLQHRALPELDFEAIDPSIGFMGKRLALPLLISCMTGGDHELTRRVNHNLALAAEQAGVAMGVGSQRVMFTDPKSRRSFALRPLAPTAVLLANLGAIQLNYGFDEEMCAEAVAAVGADGVELHLNPLQEAVQAGGDTRFGGLADRIGTVAQALAVPVVVKEVGAGLSLADGRLLAARGVRYLDVAGSGGTSWSRIESYRQSDAGARSLGLAFQDWGLPTPQALMDLAPLRPAVTLIASGGVRNGIDMVKALILGASLAGVARPFLAPAMESPEAVLAAIHQLQREFVTAMFLLGVARASDLIGNRGLLRDAGLDV